MPVLKFASPALRYWTCTDALRLSSPSIRHSNPRLDRVGGLHEKLTEATGFAPKAFAAAKSMRAANASAGRITFLDFIMSASLQNESFSLCVAGAWSPMRAEVASSGRRRYGVYPVIVRDRSSAIVVESSPL